LGTFLKASDLGSVVGSDVAREPWQGRKRQWTQLSTLSP
jgi:hypothetical protein